MAITFLSIFKRQKFPPDADVFTYLHLVDASLEEELSPNVLKVKVRFPHIQEENAQEFLSFG